MPQRTNAFQRIVALLNATLADDCLVGESVMLRDKVTGEQREVDILIESTVGAYKFTIGIEVVNWARQAGTPWVERMRQRHMDLPVDKLVLVSSSGFTDPAKRKAQFYGIEALTVEKALEADWSLVAGLGERGAFETATLNYDCTLVCDFADGTRKLVEAPLNARLSTSAGVTTLDEFVRSLVSREDFRSLLYPHIKRGNGRQEFWFSYTEDNGLWNLQHEGQAGQVQELRVGVHVTNRWTPVEFSAGRYAGAPFVSGLSTDRDAPLQFVLARTLDGGIRGKLVDGQSVHSLTARIP